MYADECVSTCPHCVCVYILNLVYICQGLEAQLLGIVVRKERPELEEQKDSLVINIASGKRKLQELEDEILRYIYI